MEMKELTPEQVKKLMDDLVKEMIELQEYSRVRTMFLSKDYIQKVHQPSAAEMFSRPFMFTFLSQLYGSDKAHQLLKECDSKDKQC